MAYADFTIDTVDSVLGVSVQPMDLFPDVSPVAAPTWLTDLLARGLRQALLTEKARSEFLVTPLLLASQEIAQQPVAIYSGQRLDVDPEHGLVGECDFILAATPPIPTLRAPLLTIVEAKRNDIENGIGQCIAQMVGASIFNERAGKPQAIVYGCVTTGENWQFLQLEGRLAGIDRQRYYIDNVGGILAVLLAILARGR